MVESLKVGLLFLSIALFMLASIEFISRKSGLRPEYSRKLAHIGGGLLAVCFLPIIADVYIIFAIVLILTLVLFLTRWKRLLDSVHEVSRETLGSIIFPFPFFVSFFAAQYFGNSIYFYLPILILVFSDPAATLVGDFFRWKRFKIGGSVKSLSGSLAFFVVTILITVSILFVYVADWNLSLTLIVLSMSLLISLAEALSGKGSDNITVPVTTILLMMFFGF